MEQPSGPSERRASRFAIKVGRRSRPLLRLFGVKGDNAYVDLGDELDARFGWARLRTPVANIESWRIEGPWLWITAIGVRRSIRHHDLTFAGTARGGVRMDFREPVRALGFGVPALYVTVDDLEGFAAALGAKTSSIRSRLSELPAPHGEPIDWARFGPYLARLRADAREVVRTQATGRRGRLT